MTSSFESPEQVDLFPEDNQAAAARSQLDQLLADSRMYSTSADHKALLDFVVRLRNFAPFNAMLLQIQKPGLMYAASARDWRTRFGRHPKEDARPLLILWPFGPVALVYDVNDTEGRALPDGVNPFAADGEMTKQRMDDFAGMIARKDITVDWFDAGDGNAGKVRMTGRGKLHDDGNQYRIGINKNHAPPVQFATLAHELGHLLLGHLGQDKRLGVPARPALIHRVREIEAESVAYLVCMRNGVAPNSQSYLSTYVSAATTVETIDFYQIMRAAGQVEAMLGLAAHTKFDRP